LIPDEMREIANQHFSNLSSKLCPLELEFGEAGTKYDDLIAGWTKYWNDVLYPEDPLDLNLVKALIATESSFNPTVLADRKNPKSARGLMQITDGSRVILGNEKGELKNHYILAKLDDLNDPIINICAGIRWLFRKRQIASEILKCQATWEETVYEFKGCRTVTKEQAKKLMDKFFDTLEKYKKCGKKCVCID
jgi:hypothetical protein